MILNVELYNGHMRQVKSFSLTSFSLEEKLSKMNYTGEKRMIDKQVENLLLPPFALSFYTYLYDTGTIPTEDEFVEHYLNQQYFECLDDKVRITYQHYSVTVSLEGLISRALRTYPSVIRDLHFYLMAYESGYFKAVHYSFKNDYNDKIDVRVLYDDKWYNVGLLLDSKRSLSYKDKKEHRHKPVNVIYITLQRDDAKWVGNYMLYNKKHIQNLYDQIESEILN